MPFEACDQMVNGLGHPGAIGKGMGPLRFASQEPIDVDALMQDDDPSLPLEEVEQHPKHQPVCMAWTEEGIEVKPGQGTGGQPRVTHQRFGSRVEQAERRAEKTARGLAGRGGDRFLGPRDLLSDPFAGAEGKDRMGLGVVGDEMAFVRDPAQELGMLGDELADRTEDRPHAMAAKHIEQARRGLSIRIRPVIEGEDHVARRKLRLERGIDNGSDHDPQR